jgi:hypothetical protein
MKGSRTNLSGKLTYQDLTAFDGIISTTMAKVIWVGTIEISYLDHEDSDKRKNAFTVVTTWASSVEEFRRKCELLLESYGWKLLGIDRANPAAENYDYNEEVADQLEKARVNPNAIIYGTFYTYPVM